MTDLPPHHITRIDHAHQRLDRVEGRVSSLERAADVASERLRHIQQSLDGIQAGISRLGWLFVTGLVGGAVAFVIQGGLSP